MSEFLVAKYGGSSMAQPEAVAAIMAANPQQRLGIVSAPGISDDFDIKLTDILYYHGAYSLGIDPRKVLMDNKVLDKLDKRYGAYPDTDKPTIIADDVVDQFDTVFKGLNAEKRSFFRGLVYRQLMDPHENNRNLAYYASRGEYLSYRYFAALVDGHTVSDDLIRFRDDKLDRQATREAIGLVAANGLFQDGRPTIYPGFMGTDQNGIVRLLGRGGSDRTQALTMDGLGWDGENWTDVDGIYSADPRDVETASVLTEATREEIREGAHGGSGVLHGDTILDLEKCMATITVRNTFNPGAPGTRVVADRTFLRDRQLDPDNPIVAVSGRALMELRVHDPGMADKAGYIAALLHRTGELGINIEHLPASQDRATITFHEATDAAALEELKRSVEFHAVSTNPAVQILEKGVVYVIGEELRSPEVITRTLGRIGTFMTSNGMAFEAAVSHPESPSLALLVNRETVRPLVAALHAEFIEQAA